MSDGEPVKLKKQIPEDKICGICENLINDAMMVPCCGKSFCDLCIRSHLLESEEQVCPGCKEKSVSPADLIPNRYLRNAVANYKKETDNAKHTELKQEHLREPIKPGSQPSNHSSVKAENTAIIIEKQETISASNISKDINPEYITEITESSVNPIATENCTLSNLEREKEIYFQPSTVSQNSIL